MHSKYIPCDVHLEPVESVNNTGFLRIELVHARNLRAADRGGKSDPYVKLLLDGEQKLKSKTVSCEDMGQDHEVLLSVKIGGGRCAEGRTIAHPSPRLSRARPTAGQEDGEP